MRVVLIVVLLAVTTSEVTAQTTRADELRTRREAKARQLQRVDRTKTEALLFEIENGLLLQRILYPPRGFHVRVGGVGEGAGFGLGPGFRYQTGAFDFHTSAAATFQGYKIVEAALLLPGLVHDGAYAELYGRYRDFPQEDFFGIGPDSQAEDRSNYALEDTLARATAGVRGGGLTAAASVSYLAPSTGPGTDIKMPSVERTFSPSSLPGFRSEPSYLVVEPFVEFSNADPPLNPTSGGRYRLAYRSFRDRDTERFSFNRWDFEARQYVPFLGETRTIALHALVSSAEPDSEDAIPFYLLPTLGGAYSLRGFRTFRFRDRSLVLLQSEYRWRINDFVTGAVFYDIGAVAPRLSDLGRLERDYGIGLRAGSRNGVSFRADVALGSGEGTRILLRFDNAF